MPDPVDTPAPPADTAPWYGDNTEIKGYLDNRGWTLKPVNEVALEAIKAHRAAEAHIGVPPERIARLPAGPEDAEGQKAFYAKIGVPAEATGYDLSGVKQANGTELDQRFSDFLRTSGLARHVPAAELPGLAADFLKFQADGAAADTTVRDAALIQQRQALKDNWGPNYEANQFIASQAAKALGFTPEEVQAWESMVGYEKVMEKMRLIGTKIGEDRFVSPGGPVGGPSFTKEGAQERLAALKSDPAWANRLLANDVTARAEFNALTLQIAGGDDTNVSRKDAA